MQITSGDPAAIYGFLQIDDRVAVVGEEIYIPQYPGGRAKELGIYSTHSNDADALCHVNAFKSPCSGSGYQDVGYFCDTEGGSSGSPVLAKSSHKVIALHHCAYCENKGVPIDLVHAEIGSFLGQQTCTGNGDCDDGLYCNGAETCAGDACQDGTPPCDSATEACDETRNTCMPCNNDGTCDAGEDCNSCPNDCIGGATSESCGNGICETGDGSEDCVSCPQDCNGVQNGKKQDRFCCGDGGCTDDRCFTGGWQCTDESAPAPTQYCCGNLICEGPEDETNCAMDCPASAAWCGDGSCDAGEDPCNCPGDCGAPPDTETSCTDGVDNDCDGAVDCDDPDCASDSACRPSTTSSTASQCGGNKSPCNGNGDCCSNSCKGGSCRGNG